LQENANSPVQKGARCAFRLRVLPQKEKAIRRRSLVRAGGWRSIMTGFQPISSASLKRGARNPILPAPPLTPDCQTEVLFPLNVPLSALEGAFLTYRRV